MAYGQSRNGDIPSPETILTTVAVGLIAGVALGGMLHATGQLNSVAAFYSLDGVVNEWTLVFGHSLVASAVFVSIVNRIARGRYTPRPLAECPRSPFLCACVGVTYGVVLWVSVIAYGVPLALGLVTGSEYGLPHHQGGSFLVLIVFGAVLGAWYPLVREFFADQRGSTRRL